MMPKAPATAVFVESGRCKGLFRQTDPSGSCPFLCCGTGNALLRILYAQVSHSARGLIAFRPCGFSILPFGSTRRGFRKRWRRLFRRTRIAVSAGIERLVDSPLREPRLERAPEIGASWQSAWAVVRAHRIGDGGPVSHKAVARPPTNSRSCHLCPWPLWPVICSRS